MAFSGLGVGFRFGFVGRGTFWKMDSKKRSRNSLKNGFHFVLEFSL
nr:MAG TPA_asm: hypothetical protein [Caudoviricetes sp.]